MKKTRSKNGDSRNAVLVSSVAKSFKSDYIMSLADSDAILAEDWIPVTNEAINYIAGDPRRGAFPQGKLTEIYGKKSSGKSLIMYDAGMQCQKAGGIFVLIDSENSLHAGFAKHIGLDFDTMIYAALKPVETILSFISKTVIRLRKKNFKGQILIGWDSVAAANTLRAMARDMEEGKSDMGWKAQVISQLLPHTLDVVSRYHATFIVINQTRVKIGGSFFGSNEVTTSGNAIPFYASMRMHVTRTKRIKKGKRVIGHDINVDIEKNKVRPPFGRASIRIHLDKVGRRYGLDRWSGLIDALLIDEIIKAKTKKTFYIKGKKNVTFTSATLHKHWKAILKSIPRDLYKKEGKKSGGKKNKKKRTKTAD